MKWIMILTMLITASVHAGEREGGNGPDTKGQAVPVELERSFSVEELENAMTVCGKQLALSIYKQFFRRKPKDLKPHKPSWDSDNAGHARSVNYPHETNVTGTPKYQVIAYSSHWINKAGSTLMVSIDQYGPQTGNGPFDFAPRLEIVIDVKDGDIKGLKKEYRYYRLLTGVPTFGFEMVADNVQYNDYGDLISYEERAANLQLVMPETDGKAIPLYRIIPDGLGGTVGAKTKVTVNTIALRNCLKAELELE